MRDEICLCDDFGQSHSDYRVHSSPIVDRETSASLKGKPDTPGLLLVEKQNNLFLFIFIVIYIFFFNGGAAGWWHSRRGVSVPGVTGQIWGPILPSGTIARSFRPVRC